VEDSFLSGTNPSYNSKSDPFILGYTGRFQQYDNLDILLDAMDIVRHKGIRIKLYMLGDGTLKKSIEKKVKRKDLEDNVIFFGKVPHPEVSIRMNEMHALVLPMVNYICPTTIAIKILEAVLKGKIVITNKSGNNRSLFHPYEQKYVFEELTNPEIIASKILEIAQNYDEYLKIIKEIAQNQRSHHSKNFFGHQIVKTINNFGLDA
jgi:glycosyltransferase involved in cell wall biosynthesis